MKSASLPTGTSQLEIKVTLRHRSQVNDTFSLMFDVEASDTAKQRYLRWIKLIGDLMRDGLVHKVPNLIEGEDGLRAGVIAYIKDHKDESVDELKYLLNDTQWWEWDLPPLSEKQDQEARSKIKN